MSTLYWPKWNDSRNTFRSSSVLSEKCVNFSMNFFSILSAISPIQECPDWILQMLYSFFSSTKWLKKFQKKGPMVIKDGSQWWVLERRFQEGTYCERFSRWKMRLLLDCEAHEVFFASVPLFLNDIYRTKAIQSRVVTFYEYMISYQILGCFIEVSKIRPF